MPFEFAFLDWLYQFRNPVMNTISIFLITPVLTARSGIAFTPAASALPAHPQSGLCHGGGAGAVHGGGALLPQAAVRPPPPLRSQHLHHHAGGASAWAFLPLRAHRFRGGSCLRALAAKPEAGRARAGAGSLYRLYPAVPLCTSPPMSSAAQCWASHWALRPPHLQNYMANRLRNNKLYKNFRALFIPAAVSLTIPP